ncbi:MAG: hypothetical protein ACKO9Z_04060 [Planctomycetota bacterium]
MGSGIALHLDATRARAACLGPSGAFVQALDSSGMANIPMVVAAGGRGGVLCGRQAVAAMLEQPSRAAGSFLHLLGIPGANVLGADPHRLLEAAVEPLGRIGRRDSAVCLAAPGYLDDTALTAAAKAVESAGWKVRVAAPSALALWAAARSQASAPTGIVCECDDRALTLTVVEEHGGWVRVGCSRVLRPLALPAWRKAIVSGMADAVIRECRRDPRATPGLDGALSRQAMRWLDEDSPPPRSATLELAAAEWSVKLPVTREMTTRWCAPLLRSLQAAVSELQALWPVKALVLGSTANLPGVALLAEALHENWLGPLDANGPLLAQLDWLEALGRDEASAGLWREAPLPEAMAGSAGRCLP